MTDVVGQAKDFAKALKDGTTYDGDLLAILTGLIERIEGPRETAADVAYKQYCHYEKAAGSSDVVEAAGAWHADLLRRDEYAVLVPRAMIASLVQRVARYEKEMPSWAHGTPEDYDHWLRQLTPVDRRLEFYQWIGEQAVTQMLDELTSFWREDPLPAQYKTQIPEIVDEAISHVDPRRGADPAPSVLPKGKHMCDVVHHNHTDGMGYLPTCRVDFPE